MANNISSDNYSGRNCPHYRKEKEMKEKDLEKQIKELEKMIKKYWFELILLATFVLSVGILVGTTLYSDDIKHLKNEVVEAYDKGYSDGENDALIDLMEDYYDVLIENAILKERLKNQPSNEEYIQQIIDDFELTVELLQHYYQENITTHSFSNWIQINYPALYERVLNYY